MIPWVDPLNLSNPCLCDQDSRLTQDAKLESSSSPPGIFGSSCKRVMLPSGSYSALRRVVVTGVGIASPLGVGRDVSWHGILGGRTGLRAVRPNEEDCWTSLPQTVGQIPESDEDKVKAMCASSRGNSRFVALALLSADEAVEDAGDGLLNDPSRCGSSIGSGIGALEEAIESHRSLRQSPRRVSPFFVPRLLVNMAAGGVSIAHGLRGPQAAPASACAAGAQAIGQAYRIVQYGEADVMLAGGTEACVTALAAAGFDRAKALSKTGVSAPFDHARNGFVLSEGAAVLVLEELGHALRRRAPRMYAEICGYGSSADAFHLTSPLPDGTSAAAAMTNALAGSPVDTVDYVNAHAASTQLGDAAEALAIRSALGRCAVSSTKGATGHLLGAAGALEAAFAVLSIADRVAPFTLNLHHPLESDLDFITREPRPLPQHKRVAVISNSFGFGGVNASLLFTSPT